MRKNGIQAFISYRRSTGRETARNIYERLSLNGINTFFDYNSMRNGRFNTQIYDAIEQADDFILILSKDALDRCVNPDDWVRLEIEHALKFNKNIIIVSTEGEISFPDILPRTLIDLPSYHAMTLNQEYYEEGISRLLGMLSNQIPEKNSLSIKINNFLKKSNRAIVLLASILCITALCVAIAKSCKQNSSDTKSSGKPGLTAKIYLPRYADLDREVLDNPWFSKNHPDFEYRDTIVRDQYSVFPHSPYFTDNVNTSLSIINQYNPFYHNLPLRLSIHNTKPDTQVINYAELEIMEIHPLPSAPVSIYYISDSLKFVSQSTIVNPRYKLSYSLLAPGESFTDFKHTREISTPTYAISLMGADSIKGRIISDNSHWDFACSVAMPMPTNEPFQTSKETSSAVCPASSNVKVFFVNINSMDAPSVYNLDGISRQVVKGEVDDDMYIIIRSNLSFDAKIRVKILTVTQKCVYTEPIFIKYINPSSYDNEPF